MEFAGVSASIPHYCLPSAPDAGSGIFLDTGKHSWLLLTQAPASSPEACFSTWPPPRLVGNFTICRLWCVAVFSARYFWCCCMIYIPNAFADTLARSASPLSKVKQEGCLLPLPCVLLQVLPLTPNEELCPQVNSSERTPQLSLIVK